MKKIFSVFIALLLVFGFSTSCFGMIMGGTTAQGSTSVNEPSLPRVVDNAELLTTEQEEELSKEIAEILAEHGQDILLITDTNHGDFANDEEYLEAIWDNYGYGIGEDCHGWAILICMECRSWYHSACGSTQEYLTYDTVNIIDDFMYVELANGNIYEAYEEALDQLDDLFELGPDAYANNTYSPLVPDDGPDYPNPQPSEDTSLVEKIKSSLIFAIIVGLIAGLIAKGRATASMKTIARANSASAYIIPGSFNLRWADNVLVGVRESVTHKADNDNHGNGGSSHHSGGSSFHASHTSSGGHSHTGGGGRHF